jgi:HK97 family phage major capsid protein
MDKKEELKGLLKELAQDEIKAQTAEMADEIAAQKETNEKLLADNKEFKEAMEKMQGKQFKMDQNTGSNLYTFKGYNPNMTSNFKAVVDNDVREEVAKFMIEKLSGKAAYTTSNTGAYAIPVEYTNALLGLAELKSIGLSKARVFRTSSSSLKMPAKGTRATTDAQAFGTANADAATTLAQLSFTIDKRVGSYQTVNNDVLADEIFDVVGDWIEPAMAEAIGQDIDDEMFNGTEYTTSVSAVTASVTASGTTNIGNAITYANLVTMAYAVELERGISPEWFLPRGAMKDIVSLVSASTGTPIFNPVPISGAPAGSLLGYPINITPAIDNTPDDGAIRIAFGDPKEYIIAMRGSMVFDVNPYILMKEGQTQFIGYMRSDGNYVNSGAWTTMQRDDS